LRNHGFTPYYDTRWLWVEDPYEPSILLKGERPQLNLGSARLSTEKKRLAGFYKIHLMPTEGNIDDVFERLLVLIKNNKKLQDVVSYVKIMPRYGEMKARIEEAAQTGNLMYINPLIVVYPAEGKKNAQQALNIIYQAFKDTPGMNITPRFNAKVTDLIYVSQGDADFKSQPENQPYYEQPYKVYYSKEILPEDGDHYLRFPGTDKPITDVQ
jgi:hypothetical protein